ncbi:hypothetical protein PK28_17780 (plasmid) [Hymenobacter sp. DG25B]|uniref:hypothetical protein n=1 Tax=Hymenobacter sp. DG25B TaxID=1385664 RepID=UPI00054103AD|nr:hypothetical protein [Hymenobacter sp. DG25B]AIZ65486.1 hypothetical protein PK28_17780 [Hymenobacter sp. DG25B]
MIRSIRSTGLLATLFLTLSFAACEKKQTPAPAPPAPIKFDVIVRDDYEPNKYALDNIKILDATYSGTTAHLKLQGNLKNGSLLTVEFYQPEGTAEANKTTGVRVHSSLWGRAWPRARAAMSRRTAR